MRRSPQVVFLILVVFAALTGSEARAQQGDTNARLVDSFGRMPNGDFRGRLDALLAEISNNPGSKALIYTHGTPSEIAARTRYYKNQIAFRQFDASRIKFIDGRNIGNLRTDMWLIPAEAAPPELRPDAWIFRDVGRATKDAIIRTFLATLREAINLDTHQTYIINYGTPAQVSQRERWIRNAIVFRRFDSSRITLVNGGNTGTVRTVFWLVPPGAENPIP